MRISDRRKLGAAVQDEGEPGRSGLLQRAIPPRHSFPKLPNAGKYPHEREARSPATARGKATGS